MTRRHHDRKNPARISRTDDVAIMIVVIIIFISTIVVGRIDKLFRLNDSDRCRRARVKVVTSDLSSDLFDRCEHGAHVTERLNRAHRISRKRSEDDVGRGVDVFF